MSLALVRIALALVVLVVGAEVLVAGATALGRALGLSRLVIGLTIVAFGTSAPELAVSVAAGLSGSGDVALGNVVGSNVCNVLLILGLAAAVAPLAARSRLVRVDTPVMIAVSSLAWLAASDGTIDRLEGLLGLALLALYTWLQVRAGRKEGGDPDAVNLGEASRPARGEAASQPADGGAVPAGPGRPTSWLRPVAKVLAGLALLVLGARLLVGAAVEIATSLGVGELVVGLTIVAVGTSLPELATSVVASYRGEREIAVGNVVGSNVFNLLGVLGLSAASVDGGIPVGASVLGFDLPILVACAIACLPVLVTGARISRGEGWLFLAAYAAYVAVLLRRSGDAGFGGEVAGVLPWVLTGLTALALAPGLLGWLRRSGREPTGR